MPNRNDVARPFIKWAGGKRSILKELLSRIPEEFNTYLEPFVGGRALFWNIPRRMGAYLADINFHLIITYRMIRNNVEDVITRLEYHKKYHGGEYYKEARDILSNTEDPIEIATLFIYLNKTCYNGLYRVNKSGIFNVPIGKYDNPKILDTINLYKCSKFLSGIDIYQHNFYQTNPKKGDFIYLDPPYHQTFNSYDSSGFGDKEHELLADFCKQLDSKGGLFMLSNSDTPFIRKLYNGYNIGASRFISCKINEGKKENELIIRNYVRRDES